MTTEIAVVGGAYGEECCFPRRKIIRGSGGRAAAILNSLGVRVTFHTMTGPELGADFAGIARQLGYTLEAHRGASDIWFRYRYPLARPNIHPHSFPIWNGPANIEADQLLVFGMLEGRPATHGKRVVYDPQDGVRARSYSSNGSSANDLAVVVSYSEGRAITGQTEPDSIALALLQEPSASVAIVKCGPQGALVRTAKSTDWVYPFPTSVVYKIGSGDAFSAAFAYAWLANGTSPVEAAWFASRVAAGYVETGQDRFTSEQADAMRAEARHAHRKHGAGKARPIPNTQIYVAGPFFNTQQQWAVDEARDSLTDMGFKVFSPIHDVGEGPPIHVASKDLDGLNASGVVLALLDGLDPGTIFEVGYAVAKGIPVVAVAESVTAESLTMLLGSGCYLTNDLTTGLYAACWKVMGDV